MDLFICSTALQTVIAQRIIHEKKLINYEIFYFTHVESDKEKYYFHQLENKSRKSIFYLCRTRFPKYFLDIKRLFKAKKYNCIYLASVDNVYAHLVLTHCVFSKLITFDDGASNISKDSIYYISRRSKFTAIIYFLLGCRYSLEKVKRSSVEHFSIYPNRKNIIDNVSLISLFGEDNLARDMPVLNDECHVFLGSLLHVVANTNADYLSVKLEKYFKGLENFFYIQHPKDNSNYFNSFEKLPGNLIAEDLIVELGKKFKTVNVYGIGSAALFNLIGVEWVNIHTLVSPEVKSQFNDLSHSLVELGGNPFHIE
ncbi:glycosyltransferase family 52 [Alkalimonas sp. NCh-2]|uniref:glycosyltransferase family 52 n=1 Tax=Alkalimonas sp. NCh-2 TaxID=3144846 RepID=UPI0031F63496